MAFRAAPPFVHLEGVSKGYGSGPSTVCVLDPARPLTRHGRDHQPAGPIRGGQVDLAQTDCRLTRVGAASAASRPTKDDAGRALVRAERIGIVLQCYNLISFLTANQVWGLSRSDLEWSTALDTALLTSRRDDLKHGTNAAYVAGCVCDECREHQRQRMARNR